MDDLLVSSQFVYDLDEVLSQWSSRSEISKQIGEAMALHYDERIARVIARPPRPLPWSPVSPAAST